MERNFFRNLPSEITTEILSRLPIRSIALSKCVCKSWLNLLDSDDFEFKTPPALALLQQMNSTRCSIFYIEADDEKSHDLHYIPLTDFDIPHGSTGRMAGIAANGLLLLHSQLGFPKIPLFICNPITRQYIELWGPEEYILDDVVIVDDDDDDDDDDLYDMLSFGFGMSKISGQYKVVCINVDNNSHYVYTLGIGTWKRVEAGAASGLVIHSAGHVVCNGNIHWIGVYYSAYTLRICGFDLENECFGIFSPPPPPPLPVEGRSRLSGELSALRDCLYYSYAWEDEIVIWLMKEYHVEESWTILYKISTNGFDFDRVGNLTHNNIGALNKDEIWRININRLLPKRLQKIHQSASALQNLSSLFLT